MESTSCYFKAKLFQYFFRWDFFRLDNKKVAYMYLTFFLLWYYFKLNLFL